MLILDAAMLQALEDHNDITYTVDITLAGHDTIDFTFTEDELVTNGCQVTRTNSASTFPLGHVYCTQAKLLVLRTDELENVDFFNATAVIHGVYEYDNQEYLFDLGTYYLIDISIKGETIQFLGYDGVYATNIPVADNTKATLPLKATTVFRDCCAYLGINFNAEHAYQGQSSVPADWDECDITVDTIPSDTTYRQLMSEIVLLFGAIAYISPFDNYMYVVPIKDLGGQTIYSGGFFDSANPYASGDNLDGGTFDPWSTGDVISEAFTDDPDIIYLNDPLGHPEFPLQDITIDGVKASDGNYRYPETVVDDEYILPVKLSVYTANVQSVIDRIGQKIAGFTFRPFEIDYRSFPFAELCQRVEFDDARHTIHSSLITHIDIMLKGVTTFKCTAETQTKNGSTFASVTGRIKAVAEDARQAAAQAEADAASAVSQISGAVDSVGMEMMRLNSMMAMSMGMFESRSINPDTGAFTYYLHNKKTLAESDIVWRRNANAFAVSTDGGKTWRAGIDSDGHAVVNILSAVGIYADWIKTGVIKSSNNQSYWDLTSGEFVSTGSNYSATISGGRIGLKYGTYDATVGFLSFDYWTETYKKSKYALALLDHGNGVIICSYDSEPSNIPYTYAHVLDADISLIGNVGIYGNVRMDVFTLTCGQVNQSSDERLKDIYDWDTRYDALLEKISPIIFKWKYRNDTKKYIGFSAQKVRDAIDDIGITDSGIVNKEGSFYSLDYNSLFSLMLGKVKQQQKKIDSLEQRIARLEKLLERE